MATAPKCFQAKTGQLQRHWYVVDATNQVVGRLAAQIAPILMGKHRPTYTPHIDTGDYVIVTNVEKVVFSGTKWQDKRYQWYTGYPGGQKEEAAWHLHQRHPERILLLAIKRMLPKNKLGRQMLSKLKLVVGPTHEHQAQQPIALNPIIERPAPAGLTLAPEVKPFSRSRKTKEKPSATPSQPAPAPTPPPAAQAAPAPEAAAPEAAPQTPEPPAAE